MNTSTSAQPCILITGPQHKLRFGFWGAQLMLRMAGTKGMYLHPGQSIPQNKISGVIIGGGDDIDPSHYGALGDAGAEYDPERDALEMEVIRQCLDKNLPLLGICRGAQLINVVMGGTLYQDIRPLRRKTPNRNSAFPIKAATIEDSSNLAQAMGCTSLSINSLHNQAVEQLAQSLRAAAYDDDGFIQAIECPQRPFVIGVQWHPEYLPYLYSQRKLFQAFAQAVQHEAD